jgi:hypothetical protein
MRSYFRELLFILSSRFVVSFANSALAFEPRGFVSLKNRNSNLYLGAHKIMKTTRSKFPSLIAMILAVAMAPMAWAAEDNEEMITKEMVQEAQEVWGEGVVAIGKAKTEGEDFTAVAEQHVEDLYAYDEGTVLFKPTKAADDQFRLTKESAVSYFVGGNEEYPEDKGFALQPWTDVKFENAGIILEDDNALAMGNYFFTTPEGEEVKVEYTFGYMLKDGDLLINLHHSSLPFANGDSE